MSEHFAQGAVGGAPEPWGFPTDAYERDPDQVILDALLKGSYRRAFEAGCGTGVLTQKLAPWCQRLISIDLAPSAVARARMRCSHFKHVSVRCAGVTEYLPDGPLDLIILRDAGQSLTATELLRVGFELSERLMPGGELIALHSLSRRIASPTSGDSIHNLLSANLPLDWRAGEHRLCHRLDTWTKT